MKSRKKKNKISPPACLAHILLVIKITFKNYVAARPVIQVIEATTKLGTVHVNSTSNKKFLFIAEDDYYINISLSIVKNQTSLQIDGNKPDYIKVNNF